VIPLLPVLQAHEGPLRVLCIGAHCDDIEIGCGGTLLLLRNAFPDLDLRWQVFVSNPERADETRSSASRFGLDGSKESLRIDAFRDGFLPFEGAAVKEALHEGWSGFRPDVVFTHFRSDRHQDHRLLSDLTWNAYRDHLVLEYEIPKWDGDLGTPNLYVPLDHATVEKKLEILRQEYAEGSQHGRASFDLDAFRGLMSIRGLESNAPSGFAEGFHARKIVLGGFSGT